LEFRGAIKQQVPARKFGCQRLQRLEKKREKMKKSPKGEIKSVYARILHAIKNHPRLIK